jgi:hypothetical protein
MIRLRDDRDEAAGWEADVIRKPLLAQPREAPEAERGFVYLRRSLHRA